MYRILLLSFAGFLARFSAWADDVPSYQTGRLEHPALRESSGVVPSRKHKDVFWTHNDSGNAPVLYAVTRDGKAISEFKVDATNVDWEDIAIDRDGHLYVADFGNNGRGRKEVVVYQVDEPDPNPPPESKPSALEIRNRWRLHYPEKPFDAETLFVWSGSGYVVSKVSAGEQAALYRFSLEPRTEPVVLERVCAVPIQAPITGGDIAEDGSRVVLLTGTGLHEFQVDGDPATLTTAKPSHLSFLEPDAEACCFVPGGILATTEGRAMLFFSEEMVRDSRRLLPPVVGIVLQSLTQAPSIDGELNDWDQNATEVPVQSAHGKAAPSARLWAGWRREGLYLAGVVPDEDLKPLLGSWYQGDCIEVFLGREGPDRPFDYVTGDDRCYLAFARNPDGTCGKLDVHWPRHASAPVAQTRAAGRIDPSQGYRWELFLPADITADGVGRMAEYRAGSQIRLNVSILSASPRRNWYISTSNARGTWLSPVTWAIATLSRPAP